MRKSRVNLLKVINEVALNRGITYNINTGETNPGCGYSVSLPGCEQRVTIFDTDVLQAYCKQNAEALAIPGNYLGVWRHEGVTVLDISVVIEDKEEAIFKGIRWSQDAIWDNSKKDIIELPAPQLKGTEWQKETYAKEKAKQIIDDQLS